nr:hypothetical protein [Tanacetum cinerariifolium]
HEADECDQNRLPEQVCLSGGDIYDDASLLRFYQHGDISSWGNIRQKAKGEEGPEWEKFLTSIAMECMKNSLRFLRQLEKVKHQRPSTFAITTRRDHYPRPSCPTLLSRKTIDNTKRTTKEEGPEGEETTTTQGNETPQSPTLYHFSKSSSVPFPSRLKKQKKDDDDERLLFIFRKIHINLPFLEAMIHMPKGAKGKLSLSVENEAITFNIGKSRDLDIPMTTICTVSITLQNLSKNNGVDTIDHDGKWIETEKKITHKKSG